MISGVTITRDSNLKNLETSLLQQMASIVAPSVEEKKNNIKEVSFEDAIKELLQAHSQTK